MLSTLIKYHLQLTSIDESLLRLANKWWCSSESWINVLLSILLLQIVSFMDHSQVNCIAMYCHRFKSHDQEQQSYPSKQFSGRYQRTSQNMISRLLDTMCCWEEECLLRCVTSGISGWTRGSQVQLEGWWPGRWWWTSHCLLSPTTPSSTSPSTWCQECLCKSQSENWNRSWCLP